MAGPTESFQFDTFLTSTLKNYDPELRKNFLTNRPATALLMDEYGHKDSDGGRTWQGSAEYGQNPNVHWFQGTDPFSQEVAEGALPLQYDWKYLGGSLGISRVEQAENKGQAKLFSLTELRLRQVTRTMGTMLNEAIFVDAGPKAIIPLSTLISTTPSSGLVGKLDPSTNPFWRNGAVTSAGSFAANGVKGTATDVVITAFNNASDGTYDTPNAIISAQDVFEYYNRTLMGMARYVDSSSKTGDATFRSLEYNGIKWVWDRQCPSGRTYGVNTNYTYFVTDPTMFFEWTEPLKYNTQLASTRLCATRLFLCTTSRMFNFVIDGFTA